VFEKTKFALLVVAFVLPVALLSVLPANAAYVTGDPEDAFVTPAHADYCYQPMINNNIFGGIIGGPFQEGYDPPTVQVQGCAMIYTYRVYRDWATYSGFGCPFEITAAADLLIEAYDGSGELHGWHITGGGVSTGPWGHCEMRQDHPGDAEGEWAATVFSSGDSVGILNFDDCVTATTMAPNEEADVAFVLWVRDGNHEILPNPIELWRWAIDEILDFHIPIIDP